jgi:hypothetical protein
LRGEPAGKIIAFRLGFGATRVNLLINAQQANGPAASAAASMLLTMHVCAAVLNPTAHIPREPAF